MSSHKLYLTTFSTRTSAIELLSQLYLEKSGSLDTFTALFSEKSKTNIQMERNERLIYESPAVEEVLLQPDSAMLQSSSTRASTQSLDEEDYEW